MKFPVDLLADVSQAELEQSAHNYMNNLLYSNPDSPEHLTLSDSTKVIIDISRVGLVPLYGNNDKHRILALFSPTDLFTAVALYLLDQWWTVEDILKTADSARDGVVEVETVGERIVLYILNRVIYRAKEMSSEEELPFLCHGEKDNAKICWNNGEAVGFYSVKPSGSLCNSFSTRSYQLPVMDSIFVRKCHRGKGFGLQMLEDFVFSFKEEYLGLRYPLTKAMYKVCEKYLHQYPGNTDLLWEVESVCGPGQMTNIASKIQTMDLSAVSKNQAFMEESLVITEVTEKDVVMEAITTQIKEAGSMECTVEIVEEVTVRRATRVTEADGVPVAARSRSSGSKRRNTGEKITEDKSEKVIRIEDIEAESPREEYIFEQQKNEVHNASELVQTESVLSVATEQKKDEVDNAAEESAPTVTDKPATVLTSPDLEESEVTSALTAGESKVEDDTQDLNNTSCDSQITVENVASELEAAEEESQEEDTVVLVVSEDILEVYKGEEALDKVEDATQGKVSDENSEEPTKHVLSLLTHATSEGGEAVKTGRTVGKTIKTVQSEIPRRRSQRHSKPEEGVKEETTAHDGRKILRGRTVVNLPALTCKYHQHSQKVCEKLNKEIDEVAEEKEPPTTEVVEESSVTEGQEADEIATRQQNVVSVVEIAEEEKLEQLTNKEETEKHKGPGVEGIVVKESAPELQDRQEREENALTKVKEDEKVREAERSVIKDKAEDSEYEIEEPPVVQRRALRGRRKVTPKPQPTKQSKRHQQQDKKHTNEADLGAGGSAQEEEADEQVQEHGQVEQDKMTYKPEEDIPAEEMTAVGEGEAPRAGEEEDIISSAEANVERKVVQEEEKTEGVAETLIVVEEDKEEEADTMIQEPDTVTAASETVMPDDGQNETVAPAAEELQENATGSVIPKLQKATIILVDLKTSCHHVSWKEAEETTAAGVCAAPEKEQMELKVVERDVSTSVAEEQRSEPEKMTMEEEERTQVNITGKSFNTTVEAETEELNEDSFEKEKEEVPNVDETETEEEEVPVIETRVLKWETSGSKTVEVSCRSINRSKQQQEEGKAGEDITEKKAVETETDSVEVEREMEVMEEKPPTISEMDTDIVVDVPVGDDAEQNLLPAEVDEAVNLDEEEAPVVETRSLRSGTKTVTVTPSHKTARSRKQEEEKDEAVAENSQEDKPAVTTRSLRRGRKSSSATPKGRSRRTHKVNPEDEEAGLQAAIEKTDKEIEEKTEEEIEEIREETASKKEESLEPEAEVEEGTAVAEEAVSEQDVVGEQSEVMSETLAVREVEVEECDDDGKPVEVGEEVEPPAVTETRALRSGVETIKAPLKTRSKRNKQQQDDEEEEGRVSVKKSMNEDEPPVETRILRRGRKSVSRSSKQLWKEEEAPKESTAEEAEVEVEARLGSAEKPLTEDDRGKATDEHKVEVEKGVSEEGTMTMNIVGQAVVADDAVEGETDPPLAKPAVDSAILTPCEEEAPSTEEQQKPQLSDLQRVTVVLVNLKKTYHKVQEETATVEEGPKEKTAAKEDNEQRKLMEEETMAEEHVPGSNVGAGETEQEEVVVEEEGLGENVEDAVTVHNTGEGSGKETAKVDETKSVDEEEEPAGIKTRTQRSGKEAVKATLTRKSAINRKDKVQHEVEEAASENSEEEPAVRVLRRGRTSFPVTQRLATKQTHKQLQEEDGKESIVVEERKAKAQEEQAEEMIDQEKGEGLEEEEEDMTPQVKNLEPEMGVEKDNTVAEEAVIQLDVPEYGQASSPEINELAEAPAGESVDEGETLDDVVEEAITTQDTVDTEQSTSTSESAQETLLTAKDNETKNVSEEEEAAVVEARILRSSVKTVRATTRRKTTKIQDKEAAGKKSTEEDKPTVEPRVLRRGRKSAPATPRHKSKRARTQLQTEEEGEEETAPAEEIQVEEKEDNQDQKIEEQKEENMEPEVEMEQIEPVAEVSLTKQETVEEEQSDVAETSEQNHHEENEQEGTSVEKSADTDEPTAETGALRKGMKSAPATPRHKSKRARRQLQTEEEGEESAPAVETEGEEDDAGQESYKEKGEKDEGEEKNMETEVEKDVEEEEVESVTDGESSTGEAEQMKLEKGDSNEEAVEETDAVGNPSAEVEEINSAEEERTTVTNKSATTLGVEPDTAIAEEEELVEDASVVEEQEAPALTTRTLRSRTKTSHASRRSSRHKDQVVAEIHKQEEENPEEEETQEVIKLTDDSPENRAEQNAKEQAETEETSPTGKEAEPPARDTAEDQAEETDSIDDRVVEPADEEPATEEMESPEEELSESKEDKTIVSSESKGLRSRAKTVGDKDNGEEIQPPKRRCIRKRPQVDYRENEEEDEGDIEVTINEDKEDKVESDEPKNIKEAECPALEQIGRLEEISQEDNLENNMGAIESISEKGDILKSDKDKEMETAGMSQEDEQNMSEEEVEPIVIGKRVLRGRSVPSVIITPGSKSKRCSAKVQKVESLSDEESEKNSQSAQRSLCKSKGSEVTPTRKSDSRV